MKKEKLKKENLIKDIELAYRQLKSYIYHENFSLDLRYKISEYEKDKDLDSKFKILADSIIEFQKKGTPFKDFESIGYSIFPKKIESDSNQNEQRYYYTNSNVQKKYEITRVTPFINCSVNIHIISVMWINSIGSKIDNVFVENCFGNRLFRNEDGQYEKKKIHLFYRYFDKYNEWRDGAIKKAKSLHESNHDVAILNLDIKEYYSSINFSFLSIEPFTNKENLWLNKFLEEVHDIYREKISNLKLIEKHIKILPIGLLSSCIISNYYLHNLDKKIKNHIKPEYYGRYVDDILLVVSNPKIKNSTENPISDFIDSFLIKQNCWDNEVKISLKPPSDYEIYINKNSLIFQEEKVKLYHLLANESIDILNKFEEEIIKNSSEFRLQPEATEIFETFNTESYELIYSDTINKIRSIDGIKTNKLGASKHLRKLISATQYSNNIDKETLEYISAKILDYFSGVRSVELNLLWEKVITFFVINKLEKPLVNFIKSQLSLIDKLSSEEKLVGVLESLKETLKEHLHYSITLSATLNRAFFKEKIVKQFIQSSEIDNVSNYIDRIDRTASYFLDANMFRQYYSFFPLLNYCVQSSDFSYTSLNIKKNTSFKLDKFKMRFSPRFIHYHEITYFNYLKRWHWNETEKPFNMEKRCLEDYLNFNNLDDDKKGYSKVYPSVKSNNSNKFKEIEIPSSNVNESLKIGIANLKVIEENSIKSMLGKSNLSFSRLDELNIILNQAIKNNCDLLIFPEICLPYQWVTILTNFSRKNNIGVITGIEHFTENKKVYNYMLTALPFKFHYYKNLYIDFRLKKDYSPSETNQIIGRNGFKLPPNTEFNKEKLRLYKWKGLAFSSFNCFELCDIEKRSLFRGKVDFLVAIEHNRDLSYFSNIVESVSRDIHAYIIQVNASQYGDSRITRPSESYLKDIIKIKGGDNVSIMTATIEINSLRKFQSYNFILQQKDKLFKPTPPNFNVSEFRDNYS